MAEQVRAMAGDVDETCIGGQVKNRRAGKKLRAGRGAVGKPPAVGMRERKSGRVEVRAVAGTDACHLQSAVRSRVEPGSNLRTDCHKAYRGMDEHKHETVEHSAGVYVRGTRRMPTGSTLFRASFTWSYVGTFRRFFEEHMGRHVGRYVYEFVTRHDRRRWDIMAPIDQSLRNVGGVLRYMALTAD